MSVYCPQCGAPVAEGSGTCTYCGATIPQSAPQPVYSAPQQPYPQQPYGAPQQPYPQQPYGAPQQPYYGVPQQPQHPMAWYKFVVNVQLILGGIGCIIVGLLFLSGAIYDIESGSGASALIYRFLPDLKTVDSIYGFMSIAIGVFAFVAQSNLKKFKTNGPSIYYGWLGANIASSVFYLVGFNSVYSGLLSSAAMGTYSSSMVSSIVTSVALLICNVIYFNKRKDLFVN